MVSVGIATLIKYCLSYQRLRPKRVLVNHGEKSKSENVASVVYSRLRIRSGVPDNREIIKLR